MAPTPSLPALPRYSTLPPGRRAPAAGHSAPPAYGTQPAGESQATRLPGFSGAPLHVQGEEDLELMALSAAGPSRHKRPQSPPAPKVSLPKPAIVADKRPSVAAKPPLEQPEWITYWPQNRPALAEQTPPWVDEAPRPSGGSRRRCGLWLLAGVTMAAGVGLGLGIHFGVHGQQNGADADDSSASTTSRTPQPTAGGTPTFSGLAAGTYAFNGLGVDDTCGSAGLGLFCPAQTEQTLFRVTGSTGSYSVYDLTHNGPLTVLPQTNPRELSLLVPNQTTSTAAQCPLIEAISYHLTLSSNSFAISTRSDVYNADTAACPDYAVPPTRVGDVSCHCVYAGASSSA